VSLPRRGAPATPGDGPERWRVDAGAAALAKLDIPPHATRERVFDIHCSLTVRLREARDDAWHRLTVQADGRREWDRRVTTRNPGETDGLEVHFRRVVPIGEGLRLLAVVEARHSQRLSLVIEAEEG
jgi:hypothetical protein